MFGYGGIVGNRIILDIILYLQGKFSAGCNTSNKDYIERFRSREARTQVSYVFWHPRLEHARMYAIHLSYITLLAFLEDRQLG